ncbi:MAG TPA: M67 family metallopeptidase [Sphingobacteriaceae bacterium]|nr:M67 family metallopeptidase [Sphingobacteriaceae bacterium]
MTPLEIPRSIYDAMLAHGRLWAPLEACGIVAGQGDRAVRFYPTENAEKSPTRYSIPPEDILRILREIEREGNQLLAIFHTHPATPAYPSAVDIQLAYYPEAVYLIMSLADPEAPVLRGFYIRGGEVTEREVVVGP